jgi:hypothetical protein
VKGDARRVGEVVEQVAGHGVGLHVLEQPHRLADGLVGLGHGRKGQQQQEECRGELGHDGPG